MLLIILLTACDSGNRVDLGEREAKEFNVERYLGQWQEVARIDNSFERGLTRVTARYFRDTEGRVRVVNRGWNKEGNKWKEARGWIKSTDEPGRLRVSFFRPFYSDYIVLHVDRDYQYALVGGSRSNYLWILSRSGEIPEELRKEYIDKAEKMGYEVEKLIFFIK